MMNLNRIAAALTALVLVGSAGIASAEVGKRISVASTVASIVSGSYPTMATVLSEAVPTSYRSKSNFLKITTSYQATCAGGDVMGSQVLVGGTPAALSGLPYEANDEDATYQIVTKVYYLVPESLGGPVIAPESLVEVQITSNNGDCLAAHATLVVEAAK
jgi:hypothetical protein